MTKRSAEAFAVGLRPEAELLLCCARTCMDPERAERIKALIRQELDWEHLLGSASRNRIMPLLYRHLKDICPEDIPRAVLDRLRDDARGIARRNLFLTGELFKLLNLFESQGIAALPYKGPTLASSLRGNIALREFTDLDILVHKQDVSRAAALLVSRGYEPEYSLTCAQEAIFLEIEREHGFTHKERGILVELTWGLVERFFLAAFDREDLWSRLEPTDLLGRTVLTLAPEDLVLFLCVHGAKHLWGQLGWICDVAELIRSNECMDWERVMKEARELACERMLFLGLYLAGDLLGAALPEEVLRRIQADPFVKMLARQVCNELFLNTGRLPGALELFLFHVRVRERLRSRFLYCVHRAMPLTARDLAVLSLPACLFPLYYLLRPIRLAGLYILSPLKGIFNRLARGHAGGKT